jgi:rhodanese-related sulfurtransferase
MKELEKTKRISIAAMLSILVIITALLSYKRPKHTYTETTKDALEEITSTNYSIPLEKIDNPNYVLIDLRNQYEFEKGHLKNAINIHTSEILSDTYSDILTEIKEDGKTAILYATTPSNAINTYMLLQQLGYDNLKILCIENSYDNNKLVTKKVHIEKPNGDINKFIAESIKKAAVKPKPIIKKKKKVIAVKKKKKRKPEGGC